MKRKVYSFILIITTILTVIVICCFKPKEIKKSKENYKDYSSEVKEEKTVIKKKVSKAEKSQGKTKEQVKVQKEKVAIKRNGDKIKKEKKVNNKRESSDDIFTESDTDIGTDTEYPESTAVFKVNLNNIQKEISFSDKLKIVSIIKGIPLEDYRKVCGYLQSEDAVEAMIKTFKLLKKSLSEEKYKMLQQVASKYMKMDKLNIYIDK